MQDGHPFSHLQPCIRFNVVSRSSGNRLYSFSAKPIPPLYPSYTKIVGPPVSRWMGVDTPPRSRGSHMACRGETAIIACSIA